MIDFLTSLTVTAKESFEACLLFIAILSTRGNDTNNKYISAGVLTGILTSFLLMFVAGGFADQLEYSVIILTFVTVVVLIYLTMGKHNGTRTKLIKKYAESSSPLVLFSVGTLISLREGCEVIAATIGIFPKAQTEVMTGSLIGILSIGLLGKFAYNRIILWNKRAIFTVCNWLFVLMAGYYSYELIFQ